MFAGVRRSTIICRLKTRPTPPSTMLMAKKDSSAVDTERFIREKSRRPKVWPVMTEAPTPPPMAMEINTLVSE